MVKKYADVYAGFVFLIFSIVIYAATLNMKRLTDSSIGSEFAPRLVAIGIFVLSIMLIINGFRQAKSGIVIDQIDEEFEPDEENAGEANYKKVIIAILLFIIYVALMKPIGFLLMTIIYLFSTMMLLANSEQRNVLLFLVISVITSTSIYYIFKNIFYLFLPTGIIG